MRGSRLRGTTGDDRDGDRTGAEAGSDAFTPVAMVAGRRGGNGIARWVSGVAGRRVRQACKALALQQDRKSVV